MHLYTIGFTRKSAEEFFGLLGNHAITVLVDIRLKPDSQLSGFAKGRDLAYFLEKLIGCQYVHMPLFAPTDDLLTGYRGDKDWEQYERAFNQLLRERDAITQLDHAWWAAHRACLLCSEREPDRCHRRLVAEYVAAHWTDVEVHHLM
jgi:uncharacterized protein (DUF488 family)